MTWTKEWTIESVANNFKAIGMVDPEDMTQLIADSRELIKVKKLLENLKNDCLASDFNEHWDSYKAAYQYQSES